MLHAWGRRESDMNLTGPQDGTGAKQGGQKSLSLLSPKGKFHHDKGTIKAEGTKSRSPDITSSRSHIYITKQTLTLYLNFKTREPTFTFRSTLAEKQVLLHAPEALEFL